MGGGIDMPCIYGVECKTEQVARTLVERIPYGFLRKSKVCISFSDLGTSAVLATTLSHYHVVGPVTWRRVVLVVF